MRAVIRRSAKPFSLVQLQDSAQNSKSIMRQEELDRNIWQIAIEEKVKFNEVRVLRKAELKEGETYKGNCRNASEAVWHGDHFTYIRRKWGSSFEEDINHFEDDNGYDVYVPYVIEKKEDGLYESAMKEIKDAIFEACSVSTEISNESDKLIKIIEKKATEEPEINFMHPVFGETVHIICKVYKSDFNLIKHKLGGLTNYTVKPIELSFDLFDDKEHPDFFQCTIFHELTHLFQYLKAKRDLVGSDKNLYENIKNILSTVSDDKALTFANALYASFRFEQDAMVHSLYCKLMKSNDLEASDILYNSQEYEFIYDMKWALKHIDSFPDKYFNIDKGIFKNTVERGLERFKTHIGKAYCRYQTDKVLTLIPNVYREHRRKTDI